MAVTERQIRIAAMGALGGFAIWYFWKQQNIIDEPQYSNDSGGFIYAAMGIAGGIVDTITNEEYPNENMNVSTLYVNRLKILENASKAGWDARKQLWFTHLDPVGYPTIAYGHKVLIPEESRFSSGISETEAYGLLLLDIDKHANPVRKIKTPINQHQFDAITDFVYNAGVGSFYGTSSFTKTRKLNPFKKFNDYGVVEGFAEIKRHYEEVGKLNPKIAKGMMNRFYAQYRMAFDGRYD